MNQETKDKIEEFDNLMQAGLNEGLAGDLSTAEEYFGDAAYVLNSIEDESIRKSLETKYDVNPLNYAY